MFKKASFVLIVFFACNTVLSLFSSCKRHRSSSNRADCTSTCFVIGSSTLSLYDRGNKKDLQAPYTVKSTELVFKVMTKGATDICLKPKEADNPGNLSLFSTAYAFVPDVYCYVKQGGDSVISYNIYSDKDYDVSHPAGSNLKDIIETNDIPTSLGTHGGSVKQVLYEFFVDAEPASDGTHTFTIELVQQDGDVLSIKTPAIQIQK